MVHGLDSRGVPKVQLLSIQLEAHCMHGIIEPSSAESEAPKACEHPTLPTEAHVENACTAALLDVTVVPFVGKEIRDSQSVVRALSVEVVPKHQHKAKAGVNARIAPVN